MSANSDPQGSGLSDMPQSVRPIVPPPPPSYHPEQSARVTGPLKLRDTRPLAWTQVQDKLGQVEPLAIEGQTISRKKGWAGFKNPLDALLKKLDFRR